MMAEVPSMSTSVSSSGVALPSDDESTEIRFRKRVGAPGARIVLVVASVLALLGYAAFTSLGHQATNVVYGRVRDEFRQAAAGATLTLADFPPVEDALIVIERDFPAMDPFQTRWEANYDGIQLLLFSRSHYWFGPVACFGYLALIYYGPKWMENKPAYKLKTPLMIWNLLLAIYSFLGATRVLPFIAVYLYKFGWHSALCAPPVYTYGRRAVGLWTGLFIYSKYVELIDTMFIILRKRPLNFLHWYHHVTVLLYTWDAFVTEQPPGVFYCGMNYAVHSIMYFYYFLAATMPRPPKWGMFVTILQIAQMIAGVFITGVSLKNAFKYKFMYESNEETSRDPLSDGTCYISRMNMLSAAIMYSTYFYLFAVFFIDRYVLKKRTRTGELNRLPPSIKTNLQKID